MESDLEECGGSGGGNVWMDFKYVRLAEKLEIEQKGGRISVASC